MIVYACKYKGKRYVREDSVIEILEQLDVDKESIEEVKDVIKKAVD